MAFKSSAGTTAYQPAPSIQPKYGFRYSGSNFAPSMSPANIPPVNYTIPAYEAPTVAPTPYADNTSMTMGNDSDNGSAMASTQMSIDQANKDINNANIGQDFGLQKTYGPSPMNMIPGYGLFGPAVPTSGYGTPGTVSSLTGGTFDQQGRSIDPITGYANPEYATMGAFANQIMDDPLGNILGDPKNAFDYSVNDPNRANSNQAQSYEFALENSPLGKDADGMTQADKNTIAKKIGLDMGIAESSLGANSATTDAIQGLSYSDTGAATQGSQFSSTGTFSTGNESAAAPSVDSGVYSGDMTDNNSDDSFDSYSGSTSSTATAGRGQGTGTSYADDASSSNSGGGGGK